MRWCGAGRGGAHGMDGDALTHAAGPIMAYMHSCVRIAKDRHHVGLSTAPQQPYPTSLLGRSRCLMSALMCAPHSPHTHSSLITRHGLWLPRALWRAQDYMTQHGVAAPRTIYDMGCSSGMSTRWFAEHFPQAQVSGVGGRGGVPLVGEGVGVDGDVCLLQGSVVRSPQKVWDVCGGSIWGPCSGHAPIPTASICTHAGDGHGPVALLPVAG